MTKGFYGIMSTEVSLKMSNPFNITFGELPQSFVPREKDFHFIKAMFNDPSPDSKVCIISGPRGCGKTVLLTALSESFEQDGYLIIDLNPFMNLQEQFAAKLYEKGKLKKLFLQPEFSFSFEGLTFSLKGKEEVSNLPSLIETMLEYLKKKGKKVLITIDDVSANENIKSFAYTYQQLIRANYAVFLLMTGLYENVSGLERNRSLTFFLRAPKLVLEPLSIYDIIYSYKKLLNLSEDEAIKYAKHTKGYAYGYQLIGSLLFQNGKDANILEEYDRKLIKNSYSLSWEMLTPREKDFLFALAKTSSQKEICKLVKMSNGNLQTYKTRLLDKGIILSGGRGKIEFALPRFKEFVQLEERLNEE